MATPFLPQPQYPEGELEIHKRKEGLYEVYFIPPQEAMYYEGQSPDNFKRVFLTLDFNNAVLTFAPFYVGGSRNMEYRYKFKTIQVAMRYVEEPEAISESDVADILADALPECFIDNYNFGLGFLKRYRPIASAFDRFEIKHLVIDKTSPTSVDQFKGTLSLHIEDLRRMMHDVDTITERATRVSVSLKKETLDKQLLHLINTGKILDKEDIEGSKSSNLKKSIMPLHEATKRDRSDAVDLIRSNSRKMAREEPKQLMKLREDIELVTLQQLISTFEEMLNKSLGEAHWQRLFDQNPFILNMALGVPILKVQGQTSVGGFKLAGSGEKIADFLVKNTSTNNTAIVEIKTPSLTLLSRNTYRAGVFSPANELNAAVTQVLDQVYHFQQEINMLKVNSRMYDIESYSVTGVLIAGRSVSGVNEQKSFELFRGNSKNVQIITFDELLEKLKLLSEFLSNVRDTSPEAIPEVRENIPDDTLPF